MSINSSAEAAQQFEIWGDLYSVYRAVVDSPKIPSHRVYFQNLRGKEFQRPSFLFKIITERNRSRNIATRWADVDVMVTYYGTSEWDAMGVGSSLVELFSGFPQKLLPKYDFLKSPPEEISISGRDQYGRQVPSAMGIRISPDSVNAIPTETPDERWQCAVEFTMMSPRQANLTLKPYLTSASFEILAASAIEAYHKSLPRKVSMSMTAVQDTPVVQ